MAPSYKILGQSKPVAQTNTTMYTCPAQSESIVSSVNICNLDAATTTFRFAVVPSGQSVSDEYYMFYDTSLAANTTYLNTLTITLSAGDYLVAYSDNGLVSFSTFGTEIS